MKNPSKYYFAPVIVWLALSSLNSCLAQENSKTSAFAQVDFSAVIRPWDGFGFNYVETSQTFNFREHPQDYGGFSILKESERKKIINLIFGEDGLQVGLLKMFLDPWHQSTAEGAYDHRTTTRSMVSFANEGLKVSRARNADLSIITTLYGPPGYMTRQKAIRGRDLDPNHLDDLCQYYASWAEHLLMVEKLPLKYISLHNEGEDWNRWPEDGSVEESAKGGHDYNFFFSPAQTIEVVNGLAEILQQKNLKVGVTNGEYTNWYRFNAWGFAGALESNPDALKNLSLITSHGFYVGSMTAGHWFAPHSSSGTDRLRKLRPELHAWTTSTAWNAFTPTTPKVFYMDEQFIKEIHGQILDAKVNGIIPWAGIQRASHWNKPDPNPGCAIRVYDDGTWEIQKAYYYYKQVSRAGQPGMAVVDAFVMSSELSLIAFGSNGTRHPNSVVIINQSAEKKEISVAVKGNRNNEYTGFRTSGRQDYILRKTAGRNIPDGDNYLPLGTSKLRNGVLVYEAPPHSVTTFFERQN